MRLLSFTLALLTACTGTKDGDAPQDADGDGFVLADDCDDTNPSVHPGAPDPWNDRVDQECAGNDDYDPDTDGYALADDCDDLDPQSWLADAPYAGDLSSDFPSFCPGYCGRSVTGSLDLSAATQADVASLSCLTAVGGDLPGRVTGHGHRRRLGAVLRPRQALRRAGCRARDGARRRLGTGPSGSPHPPAKK